MADGTDPNIDKRVRAFRTLVNVVTRYPEVGRWDVLWRFPGDSTFDDAPPTDRAWCRVTPRTLPTQRAAFNGPGKLLANSPLQVTFEVHFPGWVWEEYILLWGAIEAALGAGMNAADRTELNDYLRAGGIGDWQAEMPPGALDENRIGRGVLVLSVVVPA